jgi:glycosyltransferase involved in cell wall biosynthesis
MMPSWHEGFGLVGWEAIAAGVPLIVGKGSGLYRWLAEWRNGLFATMVQPVDVKGHYEAPFFQPADLDAVRKALIEVATKRDTWRQKPLNCAMSCAPCLLGKHVQKAWLRPLDGSWKPVHLRPSDQLHLPCQLCTRRQR